ncbi:MAG: HAD family phosphatase [candidate division WOR-3 bacterium]|nr:MAG: HAD family phosphatase [candidate division WOR-3 bacterium]
MKCKDTTTFILGEPNRKSRYQAIIFDLGNVIINISFDKIFEYWAQVSDCEVKKIKQRFEFDDVYAQFERGTITPDTYRKYISQKLELQLSDDEFDNGWNNLYLDAAPGIAQLLKDLKPRFRLVALTNTNAIHVQRWKKKYAALLSHFEKVFCSSETGARKPEKKVYEIVLQYLEVDPPRVIFFDDSPKNVEVASAIGIKGIVVKSPQELVDELTKLGILKS